MDAEEIDLLIGMDVPEAHWVFEQRRCHRKEPHADHTPLGWVLRGPVDDYTNTHRKTFALSSRDDDVEMNLKRLLHPKVGDVYSLSKACSKQEV